jgi:hypothetical protein
MEFLGLPIDLIEPIFLAIIKARTFKRVMRLRLVRSVLAHTLAVLRMLTLFAEQFKTYVDEAIFRSRMLDKIVVAEDLDIASRWCNPAWISYIQTYLVGRISTESDHALPGVQIRLVADQICELTGEASEAILTCYIRTLCGFVLCFDAIERSNDLIRSFSRASVSGAQFEADVVDAAVKLDIIPLTK